MIKLTKIVAKMCILQVTLISFYLLYMSQKLSKFGQVFVSYGSYHVNPVNQWIHIITVPIIACTLFALISYIPLTYQLDGWTVGMDTVLLPLLVLIYLRVDLLYGVVISVLIGLLVVGWKTAFAELGKEESFVKWLILVHTVAWILQFIGHGVFEKRKPALFDSLTQIISAPLFVLAQVLMKLGLKSSQTDYWLQLVEKRASQFRQKDKVK